MKHFLRFMLLLATLVCAPVFAAEQDLTGVWQGVLPIDAKTSLTIRFDFKKQPDGSYAAVLNSPDNGGIKNMPASGVTWANGALKLQVAALSGSYAGTLKAGKIEGQWTQPGGNLPLVLSPYQKPVLTKAAANTLVGTWFGPVTIPGGTLTFILRFKQNDKGELQGTIAVQEQGGQEAPMEEIQFADNKLSLKVPLVRGEYTATVANGTLTGMWRQPGAPGEGLPVVVKKGEYAAPVYALKLDSAAFAAVNGKWTGKLQVTTPQGQSITLTIVLRIETNANGQYVGYIDSPDQKAMGIPVTEASLNAGKLVIKVDAVKAEYQADLSGKEITGQWSQRGGPGMPLTLTKS